MKRIKLLSIVLSLILVTALLPSGGTAAYARDTTVYTVILKAGEYGIGEDVVIKTTDNDQDPFQPFNTADTGQFYTENGKICFRLKEEWSASFTPREGYQFAGWNSYGYITLESEETEFTAKWKADTYFAPTSFQITQANDTELKLTITSLVSEPIEGEYGVIPCSVEYAVFESQNTVLTDGNGNSIPFYVNTTEWIRIYNVGDTVTITVSIDPGNYDRAPAGTYTGTFAIATRRNNEFTNENIDSCDVPISLTLVKPEPDPTPDPDPAEKTYTVTGLPAENASVTLNDQAVLPVNGKLEGLKAGDVVRVIPASGYEITGFQRIPSGSVITLNYPVDIWHDGTGYQMVLDADAEEYDPFTGSQTVYFTAYYSSFNAFEYRIPANADYGTKPEHFVYCSSDSITVPAGTYDFFILVPASGGIITASTDKGSASGRTKAQVFENGKAYEYTVTLDSWGFDRVDLAVTQRDPVDYATCGVDGSYSFTMPAEDVDLSVKLSQVISYKAEDGAGDEYTSESGDPMVFVFKRSFDDDLTITRFSGASVDGRELRENTDFTKKAGSLVIELLPSLLDTLDPGDHTLTVSFTDAESVSVPFTVKAAAVQPGTDTPADTPPATGVYSNIWLYLWLIMMTALAAYELKAVRSRNAGE